MRDPLYSNNAALVVTNNDLFIKQREYTNYGCVCCPHLPSDFISYQYVAPTPILEQRGLTPSVLESEIRGIESVGNSATHAKDTPVFKIAVLILVAVLIIGGFIMLVAWYECDEFRDCPSLSWAGLIVIIVGFIGLCVCGSTAYATKMKKLNYALDAIQKYVELDLNEKYQRVNGIRWSILESQNITVWKYSDGSRRTNINKYYHIGVSLVTPSVNTLIAINVNNQQQQQQPQQQNEGDVIYAIVEQ